MIDDDLDMTTISGRSRTALLVIDVQNGVVAEAVRRTEVVIAIGELIERARAAGVPVVWVQHSDDTLAFGSKEWEYVPELQRRDDEPIVHKQYGDSFEDTDLESVLADRAVGSLVVSGAQSDSCIRSTLHGALTRGYDVTLVEDAHTTEDIRRWGGPIGAEETIAFTNLYWRHSGAPGRTAAVVPAVEVDFAS